MDIVKRLLTYSDGIQGKNELRVGLLMCCHEMRAAAEEIKRLRKKLKKKKATK